MATPLPPKEFIERARGSFIIDVRSPSEYERGHIHGARNIPLFEDDERALVGTLYKKRGRDAAVETGLGLAGPKLTAYLEQLRALSPGREVFVHCWRGGMRSESMAWLFEKAGFEVNLLEGGYKAWRRFIREDLGKERKYLVLGGLTGSGKTRWLTQLALMGEQVIDLEKLACHKGSVFGSIGMKQQPGNEQFENDLFDVVRSFDEKRVIWLEDESRQIGRITLPDTFYQVKTSSPLLFISVPDRLRIRFLLEDYADCERNQLLDPVQHLAKRLGSERTKQISVAIAEGLLEEAARLLLDYYDTLYRFGLSSRKEGQVHLLNLLDVEEDFFAEKLIIAKNEILGTKNKNPMQ